MWSPITIPQLYIVGNKDNTQQYISHLTGETEELNGAWTVLADRTIGKGEVCIKELKEREVGCDDSLELSSGSTFSGKRPFATSSEPSVNMKRLKSFGHSTENSSTQNNSNIDIGYVSDSTQSTEPEEREVKADINAIVLEDDNGLHMKLASFMFKLFTWPVLIVLAIDIESTDLVLYESFIKELGVLANLQENESSKLLVVGMTLTEKSKDQMMPRLEQQADQLHSRIFDSYFGKHFDWCESNQLLCKVQKLLYEAGVGSCKDVIGRNTANQMLKGERFFETKTCETEKLSLHLKSKLLLCFKSENTEYICKPEDLINEIIRTLTKMPDRRYKSSLYDFMKSINTSVGRKLLVDAFVEAGVIHRDQFCSDKTVHIMPLICKPNIPVFDEMEYSKDTNALRLRVELDVIPKFVTANIIKLLLDNEWTLKGADRTTDSFVFVKQSRGLNVQFGILPNASYICLCGLRNTSLNEVSSESEYELMRDLFECEIRKCKGKKVPADRFISYHVKQKDSRDSKSIMKTDEGWIKVDLGKVDQLQLLSPWFSSKVTEMEKEMNKELSDALLSDISELFGYGTKLFFVSEGLPSGTLSQIEIDHQKSVKNATYEMLLVWRKRKGLKATIAALRSAIAESSHVTVNLHEFDAIVKNHPKYKKCS